MLQKFSILRLMNFFIDFDLFRIISNLVDYAFKAGMIIGMILGSAFTYFLMKL